MFVRTSVGCTMLLLSCSLLLGQTGASSLQSGAELGQTSKALPANMLMDGTPVKLRLAQTVSSADAKTGQQVAFEVVEDVQVQGVIAIAKGTPALASVTDAEHKKSMGRAGKLDINIDSVRLIDNEKVQLRATAGGKAGGHVGAMTGAIVATSIVFFPAAPLFLFIHGKDITLPKGLETTAFVEGDTKVDLAALTNAAIAHEAPLIGTSTISKVAVDASVPDCEITVDGAFSGSTPSELSVASGKHEITVRKQGYADWTRTITVSGGQVRLHADLQPAVATKASQ